MGREVRSGKNAIIKVDRCDERRRVQAPNRERGRRRGTMRDRRSERRMPSLSTCGEYVFCS